MEAALMKIVADHNLTGLGVNVFGAPGHPYIGVYVHWDGEYQTCASGSADTFDEALAKALAEMAERQKQEAA